ncbi:helix-hairpin-helix domain-containing protein [Candidatus Kaiserbacteria bacterium]|nr:helix-hairpin-helix domain-containing protein [Candidatus Kaiserbacteria bacterium]
MRFIGLLVLTFFLPAFAYAALININTADATLLDTLPGIGPSKAQAIITYRNGHGPFVKIEDIQNVSGIGPSTYADIKSLITVGDTGTSDSGTTTATSTTTSATTTTTLSVGGTPPEYIPIPTLRIVTDSDRTVSSGADTVFTAVVYDGKGNKRNDAVVKWSFGDGMQRTGASVYHQYYNTGEYLAIVRATTSSDGGDAMREMIITVEDASIKIASVSARGISLANNDSRTLDLSLWRLSMGGREFKIPADTQILAGRMILFPSQIIQLPISDTASLLYPSGEMAAMYPTATAEQPSAPTVSFNKVQTVEPFINKATDIQTHEEAVVAPAVATELVAVGATLPATPSSDSQKTKNLFGSPWLLGLLSVIALAGAAFVFI